MKEQNKSLVKISNLMLTDFKAVMEEKSILISFDKSVCEFIVEKSKNGKAGARDIRNNIRKLVEDKVVDLIIENGENAIKEIAITTKNKELVFSKK